MSFFPKKAATPKDLPAWGGYSAPMSMEFRPTEIRPCIINGRRAIFHRWINSAHPVPPRGSEINEKTRYYQFRRTEALVEYEDGTVDRVYPTEIKFVDGGAFAAFDWSGAKEAGHG